MSNELFIPIKFTTTLYLKPHELNKDYYNKINKKLKDKLEGICSKHGYIKKDSIKIVKKSIGNIIKQHFNGNIYYNIQCIAEICNPVNGSVTKCKIKNKNSMGLLAQGFYDNYPVLEIIIPKISAGIKSEVDLDKINIGDEVFIEICGKKLVLYEKFISIIGRIIKSKDQNIKSKLDSNLDEDDEVDEDYVDENFDDFSQDENVDDDDEENDDEKKQDNDSEDEVELEPEEDDDDYSEEVEEMDEELDEIIFDDN
jgi:DNA-directed RNA polymerase subunit E'/Rpb7